MRWRVLGLLLSLVLLGAVLFSLWPAEPLAVPAPPEQVQAPALPLPLPLAPAPRPAPTAAVQPRPAPVPSPSSAPPPTPPSFPFGELEEEPDPEHLRRLGLGPEDVEPRDGGVLHPLSREGIKGAITQELPQIRECYEPWLQQNPTLGGKLKVQFTIVEIPGRDRGKVMRVGIADGGFGHLMMEGCVRNVFKEMRFEAPRGGEMRVSYPLTFEHAPKK